MKIVGSNISTCLAFVDCSDKVDTHIGLFNYFSTNYDAERTRFTAYLPTLGDQPGFEAEPLFAVESDGPTLHLFKASEFLAGRVDLPYRGNVMLMAETTGGRPTDAVLQAYRAFIMPDGRFTSQHAEGPVFETGASVMAWGYDFDPRTPDVELIFQNHCVADTDQAQVILNQDDGSPIAVCTVEIPPLAAKSWRLDELVPGWAGKLSGKRMAGAVVNKYNPRRPLFLIHYPDGTFVLNHASGTTETSHTRPAERINRYPVDDDFWGEIYFALPLGYHVGHEMTCYIDNFFEPHFDYPIRLRVHDADGRCVGADDAFFVLPHGGVREFTAAEVRAHFKLADDFVGHAIMSVGPDDTGMAPRARAGQLTYVNGRKTGGMINGGYVQNTQPNPGDRGLGFRRNRTYAPVAMGKGLETYLYVYHGSSRRSYASPAKADVKFTTVDGLQFVEEVTFKPHEMKCLCMGEMMRRHGLGALTEGERGWAWVEIRSLDAQMPGIFVFQDNDHDWADLDHMFGG